MNKNASQTSAKLILASSSPYRRAQLGQLLLPFECISPAIDESPKPAELAQDLSLRLSREKARSVASRPDASGAIIIAGDQCASLNGELLGKPGTESAAIEQLTRCSGQKAAFYSGLHVLDTRSGVHRETSVLTTVSFRKLVDAEIRAYVKREHVLNCAGSFKCEGLGIALFASIESSDPSALIGLPLIDLHANLVAFGINALTLTPLSA